MITLKRSQQDDYGTFGSLLDDNGDSLCVTVELPWRDNEPQKSCIPAGVYNVIPHNSPAHPDTWEISGVPGRSEILIHSANFPDELLGCVGAGQAISMIEGKLGVTNSVQTLDKLREVLPNSFMLAVVNP